MVGKGDDAADVVHQNEASMGVWEVVALYSMTEEAFNLVVQLCLMGTFFRKDALHKCQSHTSTFTACFRISVRSLIHKLFYF